MSSPDYPQPSIMILSNQSADFILFNQVSIHSSGPSVTSSDLGVLKDSQKILTQKQPVFIIKIVNYKSLWCSATSSRCAALRSTLPQRWSCVRAMGSRWTGGRWASFCTSSWWAVPPSSETRQRNCLVRSSAVSNGLRQLASSFCSYVLLQQLTAMSWSLYIYLVFNMIHYAAYYLFIII